MVETGPTTCTVSVHSSDDCSVCYLSEEQESTYFITLMPGTQGHVPACANHASPTVCVR